MTGFLIRTARELLVGSWLALLVGAYFAISEAIRLREAGSIGDDAQLALVGGAVIVVVIYTSVCGTALVMFGVHDRLGEISNSLALVADKFCRDEWIREIEPSSASDQAEYSSSNEADPSGPAAERANPAANAADQPVSTKQSWWSGASGTEKAVIIFILALPIILWVASK